MATLPAALDLTDDLVEEFLVRLPPEDPASLVRAALVCRRWRRILARPGFRRRFCEHHHRRTPMLGFFHHSIGKTKRGNPHAHMFTPTSSFRLCPRIGDLNLRFVVDARHGRVLLCRKGFIKNPSTSGLAVWDPITTDLLNLPWLPRLHTARFPWSAVVLCASTASGSCDHLDCHSGPFLVVFVGTSAKQAFAYVYSSEAGVWSHRTSMAWEAADHYATDLYQYEIIGCNAVAGNAIYFRLENNIKILKYDLGAQEISLVDLPPRCHRARQILLTATQDGGLDVARVDMPRIHLWSMKASPDGWVSAGVIDLGTVHHANPLSFSVVDIMHSLGAIVIKTHDGVFSVDIVSKRVTKLCEDIHIEFSVPYMSFCTPELGASKSKKKKNKKKKKTNTRKKNEVSSGHHRRHR